jgi:RNA-directed DNA polymerase
METKLQDIRVMSLKHSKLETLINRVNYDSLKEEHNKQSQNKAVGVDGISKQDYELNLDENLKDLLSRMKSFSYHPKPVRRTYIPKANGDLRPLGIPSYEDKLVQGVMANILNDIYEPKFLDCSFGFRENKSVHDALREVNQTIMYKRINYILDCDIKGFFDNVDHKWLIKFLEHDIADKNFIRYIARFLKSGYEENGIKHKTSKGTPQGGLISPVLANIYLHYVLDTWFEKCVKPSLKGETYLIRFADDFLMLFRYEDEAKEVYERLTKRLAHFGLEVAQDKTRILPFGRFKGNGLTFDFLGFKHYNSKTRTGKYTVGRKISKKKRRLFKVNLNTWIKLNRTMPLTDFFCKVKY